MSKFESELQEWDVRQYRSARNSQEVHATIEANGIEVFVELNGPGRTAEVTVGERVFRAEYDCNDKWWEVEGS